MQTNAETTATSPIAVPITAGELRARMARGEPVQIIDVREYPEFAAGHIASARLVPLSELDARWKELDCNVPVVCVCRSGKRSTQATEKLIVLGLGNVSQLEGGVLAWERCGFSLTAEARAPWSLERQVRFALGLCVLLGLSLSLRWPSAIIISWMMGIGMVFTSVIDWCGMALLLAKAPWNRQRSGSCAR
jgi:rhodanese-related sulfurtransferase